MKDDIAEQQEGAISYPVASGRNIEVSFQNLWLSCNLFKHVNFV